MDPEDLVAVYSTNDPTLAAIVRNELIEAGIPATLENVNQAGFAGILDVRVLVKAKDEARAEKVLHHHGRKRHRAKDAK